MKNTEQRSTKYVVNIGVTEGKALMSLATFFIYMPVHWLFVQFLMMFGNDKQISINISMAFLGSIISYGWLSKYGYSMLLNKLEYFVCETVSRLNAFAPDKTKTTASKVMLAAAILIFALMTILQFTNIQLKTARILSATMPVNSLTTWKIGQETNDGLAVTVVFKPVDQGYKILCGNEPCFLNLNYLVTNDSLRSLKSLIKDVDSAAASGVLLKDDITLINEAKDADKEQFLFDLFLSHGVLGLCPHSLLVTIIMPVTVLFSACY